MFKTSVIKLFYAPEFECLKLGDGYSDPIETPDELFVSESMCNTSEMLAINGSGEESYETMVINERLHEDGVTSFDTNNHPYGVFARCCLLLAKSFFKEDFAIHHNFQTEWKSEIQIIDKALGTNLELEFNQYVN